MSRHDDLPYVKHILDSINDIEDSTRNLSKGEFKESKDIRDAVVRRLEVIGEAAKNISKNLKEAHPEIAWRKIAGTRDVMIHAYFNVDLDIVWEIVKKDMPILKNQIFKIQKELEETIW